MKLILLVLLFICSNASSQEVFRDIESAVGREEEVIELDLKGKRYAKLPEEIKAYKNLKVLKIRRAGITDLPDWLDKLPLQKVILTRNKLNHIPNVIYRLKGLRILDLGHNNIALIEPEIRGLQELEELNLWANLIYEFPPELSEIASLKSINLRSIDLNRHEQAELKEMLPDIDLIMSPPCNCN
ncbi:MAG: hypothetical protein AAF487_08500 [Bacteroidota bacterium]